MILALGRATETFALHVVSRLIEIYMCMKYGNRFKKYQADTNSVHVTFGPYLRNWHRVGVAETFVMQFDSFRWTCVRHILQTRNEQEILILSVRILSAYGIWSHTLILFYLGAG